jgi:hypothetical protein
LKNDSSILYWIDVCDDRRFITPTISKDEFLDMSQPGPEVSFIHVACMVVWV